ncbi:MAG TPA: glucoamylase family protein [Verrucomicrobiae bacterium]|nr:glucoamylase family protein [Verrucomicrobiae bacterium]
MDSAEGPLRAELFTVEQLIHHGKNTAEQHKLGVKEGSNRLLRRLDANEKILQAFNRTTLTVDKQRRVTPAAEWLLDNFYLIEEQIQMARRHLPRGYSRELPRLSSGASAGLPRVFDLVLELIAHVDAQIDVEHLSAFVGAYQTVTPLNLGELWAVPIMLRLGLIENLRRITVHLKADRQDRDLADYWADRLQTVAETDPSNLIVVIADMARAKLPLSSAFVAEFCQRIARLDPAVHFARNWLEQRLAENGFSVEQRILAESQNQAADQVSISHTIASLRFIGATDWRDFVESLSLVDQTLCNDPARVYKTMDFATRDRYRHAVEQIARFSKISENDVAWKAIELAEQNSSEKSSADRTAHVGYFLIDKGQQVLEKSAGVSWPWRALMDKTIRKFPLSFYAGGMAIIMVPATILIGRHARNLGIHGGELVFLALATLLCMSQMAVSLMNWLSTCLVKPQRLPRLDFSKGITAQCRTMVVVPTMLDSATGIDRLLETVEIHYLANRDNNLYFALLTDFRDSPAETTPNDAALLEQASEGINILNKKYESDRPNIFFLFHRPRQWNESEKVWMGYERKRGKLADFNAILRGGAPSSFSKIVGDTSLLNSVKFVITLDTDTQLPRDAAWQLVGTIAHPLNRPQFNSETGIVSEGYSILQPRVGVSLPSASRSWFVRLFAGDAGIDPYTREVSDVYQDVFGEGSFIGKGIYDVDAFERAVHGRFPENTILSHDLIESLHARSALISDVEFYEEHPSRYNADINRRHRWIRGDWQIAQWLLPRVPGPDARNIANPLTSLSQWKIFDNLRRSLVPAALALLLLFSWIFVPQFGSAGSLLVLGIIVLPGLLPVLAEFVRKPSEWPWLMHFRTTGKSFAKQVGQLALTLAFLPYDAFVSLDAICRTLARLLFTRKRLLQWQTSSDAERNARTDLQSFYATMWIAPAIAFAALLALVFTQPDQLFNAAPFLLLWLAAPAIAWWISQPIVHLKPELTAEQNSFLRRSARRTWRYFETFITEQENWLPPDNFQEHPKPAIACRTSPTNIGLALLANLTAYDFGYIAAGTLMDRTQKTLATLERMERYRGHFYNWYDTRTLKPLLPNYISTVDSGNLAGHLFILSSGLAELSDGPILSKQVFAGLRDTLGLLREVGGETPQMSAIERDLENPPSDLSTAYALLQRLVNEAPQLAGAFENQTDEVKSWTQAFARDSKGHLDDLLFLAPWLPSLEALKNQLGTARVRPPNGLDWEPEAPSPLSEQLDRLQKIQTLSEFAEIVESFGHTLADLPAFAHNGTGEDKSELWRNDLFLAVQEGAQRAEARLRELEELSRRITGLANMDVSFLFDTTRELFTIGYNVTERRRDPSFYDLLASEARLGSYVAIAQGQVPQRHWFTLGRLLACSKGEPVLVSWSGSMFEYLMPLLVMPTYDNTLIDRTYRAAVDAQIDYGRTRGTAWGFSESGYNLTDLELNYQYRAFGIPGLGFKRGLAEDLVVAPYASVMALMVDPRAACENLERLAAEGRMGEYGFYEAIDFTPSRLPPNETSVTIRSFMVHHQGMSLLSFAFLLLDRPMQRRFLAHPPFKASELLLQERVPKTVTTLSSDDVEFAEARGLLNEGEGVMRVFTTPNTPTPEVHLLSNGRYHVVISNSGGGYSRWQNLAITRWREDATRDCWGSFCYLRDVTSGEFWSMTYQPARELGKLYEAIFTQARAEFKQRHGVFESHVEISISPEDDVELRRITLTNHSNIPRTIELTTYAEVVLAPAAADAAHPAFGNLFVQTEYIPTHPALLCTRRARAEGERPPWMFHLVAVTGGDAGEVTYETDRAKFTGRGRNLNFPAAMQEIAPLSNSVGSVLDPIVSIRRVVTIPAQESVQIEIVMGITENRETALTQIEKYHNPRMTDRLFDLAWTHSQVSLRQIDATEADAQLYARMAGALVYANSARRAPTNVLVSNRRGQSGLWSYGVSGDAPIVLLRITDPQKMDLVRRMVQAHAYWRLKGLPVELVILNEDSSVYRQSLQDTIVGLVSSSSEAQLLDKPGGIFIKRLEQIPAEDRILMQSAARIILTDEKGTLDEQLQRRDVRETEIPDLETAPARHRDPAVLLPQQDLVYFNGLGGFASDGREYIINLVGAPVTNAPRKNPSPWKFSMRRADKPVAESGAANFMTPAPWVNVLANPRFGTLVSETGSSYTWLENSHEFRLTPWNNDPVTDISGEAFYIRDDETGEFWSPTPLPARGSTPYSVRHGFGYTVFEHIENGIASETWVYVAKDAPVKFTTVKLRNLSDRPRHLSVFGYWEWVLGDLRSKSLLHVQTELDSETGALVARNRYNTEFTDRVVFVDINYAGRGLTGDRREFIGRNGSLANPAALRKTRLSGKTGAGLDPCAALQVRLDLPAKNEREITFRLGAGRDLFEARSVIQRFRKPDAGRQALDEVRAEWQRTLGSVQIETPDLSTNFLANGWLMYQTLSARLWGRTGFYQSGGAFGFRDQLQDAMALVHSEPGRLRDQILLAAAHQFRQGDVQHWWHPPSGRGVRTHFSDDYLWLPYATCRYVNALNDTGVLDEKVNFIEGRALKPEEESYYDLPTRSEESATIYDHCVRAIENGLKFGAHGLPLIGCGDWNDGFNLIGEHGRGESVWLAFFLYEILVEFAEIARSRGDTAFVARCLNQAQMLRQNIEENAWDGQWYRRAYFDNGEPVGSQTNTECQIDSLPQSWSVITGAGDPERSRIAMRAVEKRLVRRDARLIQLFDPPFDKSKDNPGYIKGYVPGVRENGGQYTHAAIWTVMAFAKLGEADLAWDLFSLLNPINHARTPAQVATYKVEPYVVAADVYAVNPYVGRGGWTWYTGSAGWMYRLVIESLLGITLEGKQLRVQPRLPGNWRTFKVHYRYRETMYHISVEQASEMLEEGAQVTVDGQRVEGGTLPLVDDRREHQVNIKASNAPPVDISHAEKSEPDFATAH